MGYEIGLKILVNQKHSPRKGITIFCFGLFSFTLKPGYKQTNFFIKKSFQLGMEEMVKTLIV